MKDDIEQRLGDVLTKLKNKCEDFTEDNREGVTVKKELVRAVLLLETYMQRRSG